MRIVEAKKRHLACLPRLTLASLARGSRASVRSCCITPTTTTECACVIRVRYRVKQPRASFHFLAIFFFLLLFFGYLLYGGHIYAFRGAGTSDTRGRVQSVDSPNEEDSLGVYSVKVKGQPVLVTASPPQRKNRHHIHIPILSIVSSLDHSAAHSLTPVNAPASPHENPALTINSSARAGSLAAQAHRTTACAPSRSLGSQSSHRSILFERRTS